MSFADADAGKRKQVRSERLLIERHQMMTWNGLIALIEAYEPKVDGVGRLPIAGDVRTLSDTKLVWLCVSHTCNAS